MAEYLALLTTVGAAKYNAAKLPGNPAFTVSEMGIDDGNGSLITPDPAQTALINEVYRAELSYGGVDPMDSTRLLCQLIIPADASEDGFVCRGFGIYDADGDLVAVGNMPRVDKPGTNSGAIRPQKIQVRLTIGGGAVVQMLVDHSELYASMEYVDLKVQEAILKLETSISINNWKHLVVDNDWSAAIQAALDSDYASVYFDTAQEYVADRGRLDGQDTFLVTKPKRFFGMQRPFPVIRWSANNRPNGGCMFKSVGDTAGLWMEGIRFLGNRPYQVNNTVTGQDHVAFSLRTGSLNNIQFINCRFQDFGCPDGNAGGGIFMGSLTGTNRMVRGIKVLGCDFTNIRNVPGVYLNADGAHHNVCDDINISGNAFRNDAGVAARQNCIYVLGMGLSAPATNVKIRDNFFRHADSIDCDIEINFVHDCEISGNDSQSAGAASATGILIRDNCNNVKVFNNTIKNYGTGNKASDGTAAISLVTNLGGSQSNIAIYNNTVWRYDKQITLSTGSNTIDLFGNTLSGESTALPSLVALSVANANNVSFHNNNVSNVQYAVEYYSGTNVKVFTNEMKEVGDGTYGAIMESQATPPAVGLQIFDNDVTLRGNTAWFVHVGPATTERNRIGNNRITNANKPQVNPYFAHLWGTVQNGADTSRASASTSSAVIKNAEDVLNLVHTSPSQVIGIARLCQAVHAASGHITGGGHPVGLLGNCSIMAGAGNAPQAIGLEGRVDVYSGYTNTLGTIKPIASLANIMGGTHPLMSMTSNEAALSAGATVSELRGTDFVMIQQNGTIGKLVGTHFPDLHTVSNIAEKWAFEGLDPTAPIYNKAPVCSGAYGYATPSAGGTVTIPPMISDFQLLGASTLASLTLNFPPASACVDGQEIVIGSQMAITALTLNTPAGTTMLNKPTNMTAGGVIRYKFYKSAMYWLRR